MSNTISTFTYLLMHKYIVSILSKLNLSNNVSNVRLDLLKYIFLMFSVFISLTRYDH